MGAADSRGPNGTGPVTLRAVAARAGVSKSLVSRVLQGSPHVSEEKRRAVEEVIRELGYRPNATARSLTQRRTGAIGVLVNDLRQPWFVDVLEGLDSALRHRGLHAFVGDGRLDRASDERLLRAFMEMRVDGLVLAGTMPPSTTITEAARWLPTVVVGSRDFELPHVDVVAEDDSLGARQALDHLYETGHRRIAHIAGSYGKVFDLRRAAYEAWMAEKGLQRQARVVTCDLSEEDGHRAAVELLDQPDADAPTAVFVANDLACIGAMAAAQERGWTIPGDVSFVSFDNSFLARMRHISLTSVDIAPARVGALAGQYLIERIAAPDMDAREHLVTPHLEIRGSSGPPRS